MASPAIMSLAPTPPADGAEPQSGTFAVFGRQSRTPRVFALQQREREFLAGAVQSAAGKKLGLRLAGGRLGWGLGEQEGFLVPGA